MHINDPNILSYCICIVLNSCHSILATIRVTLMRLLSTTNICIYPRTNCHPSNVHYTFSICICIYVAEGERFSIAVIQSVCYVFIMCVWVKIYYEWDIDNKFEREASYFWWWWWCWFGSHQPVAPPVNLTMYVVIIHTRVNTTRFCITKILVL